MKRHLLISLLTLSLTITPSVFAQTATQSATNKKIEDLKDRLATKVAQLRQTSRRAIYGTVKSTSITSFVVETKTKDVKIELTDEIKVIQYLKGERTALTSEDIAKNDLVSVFGDYDTTLDLLKATIVVIQRPGPERISGTVTARDDKEYTVTIKNPQGVTYIVDIEKSTKTLLWDREKKGLVKSGFSKIVAGNVVHIVGFPVPKKELRMSADRILDLGNLNAPTGQTTQEASPAASPTKQSTR